MNWIIPNVLLAMSSPIESDEENLKSILSMKDYSITLKHFGIKSIIRLNEKQYDENKFIEEGFQFYDFYFPDGSVPSDIIVYKYL